MKLIAWEKLPKEELEIIDAIVERFDEISQQITGEGVDSISDITMDIGATHLTCPLRLEDMLNGEKFDLVHDIVGISSHLNRETGELEGCFVPRFARNVEVQGE